MKTRDRHKSLDNDSDYKFWRNKVNKMIKHAKKTQYQTYIDNNKDKPGSMYKLFQEVGSGKGCRKTSISSIKKNGIHTEDPRDIANAFNNFFVNVAAKIKEPVLNQNHEKLKTFCQSKLSENTTFSISPIEKVLKQLSAMDTSKATGTDNVGPRLLKLAAPYISDDITYICNQVSINLHSQENGKKPKFLHFIKMGHMMMLIIIVPYRFYLYYQKSLRNMCMIVYQVILMRIIYYIGPSQAFGHSILVKLL